ncbi:MAG: DUF3267 domain-containing protein [Clostridia bacterium]|nr:DUF3267 domain-containing protein [Clostridia bacterium]
MNHKKNINLIILLILLIVFCVYRIINLNLVWQGISVRDINMDFKADIPLNAVKIEQPETTSEFLMKSNIFIIPIMVVLGATIVIIKKNTKLKLDKKIFRKGIFIGVLLGILCIVIHEFIHALFYPNGSTVNIGIVLNPFYAYVSSLDSINRNSFILMSIMPFLILGVIPFSLFIYYFTKKTKLAGILLGFCIMGLVGGTPDLYNIYNISKQVPNNAIIINSENLTYWYK